MRVPLRETAVITLNGSGAGTASVGPLTAREVWYPDNVAVKCAPPASGVSVEAQVAVYMGDSATQPNFRDNAVFGTSGDNTGACNGDQVKKGHKIWAVFSAGNPNVQATVTVTGMRDV